MRNARREAFEYKALSLHGRTFPYAVYLPPGFEPADPWPLILFLHGAGERGNDGHRQTYVGLGPSLLRHPELYPAIVVLPQCPLGTGWQGASLEAALAALERTSERYQVDHSRLYLTGVSMGGFGTFLLAAEQPGKFAAAVPVCGGGYPESMAEPLKDLPLWVFHGAADDVVPVRYSREMVDAIKAEGSNCIRYTEYPGLGHNSWDRAYRDSALSTWLFEQKRASR